MSIGGNCRHNYRLKCNGINELWNGVVLLHVLPSIPLVLKPGNIPVSSINRRPHPGIGALYITIIIVIRVLPLPLPYFLLTLRMLLLIHQSSLNNILLFRSIQITLLFRVQILNFTYYLRIV